MATEAPPPAVFVVDDDRGLLRLIEKALQRGGFSTATATCGKDAIDWLAKNRADLMLLDLKLQDIEGKELINHLASIKREIPFIVITGQGDERVAVEMMKRGALDYLVKDGRFIEFVPTVVRKAVAQLEGARRLAFAEKQARLSQTVINQGYSAVLIVAAGSENPRISYANPAFTTLLGATEEQLVGNPFSVLDEFATGWENVRQALAAQEAFAGILQLRRGNAEPRTVDYRMAELSAQAGVHTDWALILNDITETKRLERELLDISDREQSRIGHDLHDNLGQQLTALELFTQAMIGDLRKQAPNLVASAGEISRQLQRLIRDVRTTAHMLSPVSLESDGLQNALRELCKGTNVLANVQCEFTCDPDLQIGERTSGSQLYRIAQEAVNNAVKHAHAKRIEIELKDTGEWFELTISDDGKGFLPSKRETSGMGLGLMQHRASLIGASLDITSRPGKGTRVICRVPKKL
jgi:two-component system, NarL family, sensor histidine kinase UhpB